MWARLLIAENHDGKLGHESAGNPLALVAARRAGYRIGRLRVANLAHRQSIRGRSANTRAGGRAGQQVFLKYGLMDNGSVWGHGAYLGPDFSAQYLHILALDAGRLLSAQRFKRPEAGLADAERSAVEGEVRFLLKQNRYDQETRTLAFTESEAVSFQRQIGQWRAYFQNPAGNGGLPTQYISAPEELRQLSRWPNSGIQNLADFLSE